MVYMGIGWGLGFREPGLGFFFFLVIIFWGTESFNQDDDATTFYDSLLGYS